MLVKRTRFPALDAISEPSKDKVQLIKIVFSSNSSITADVDKLAVVEDGCLTEKKHSTFYIFHLVGRRPNRERNNRRPVSRAGLESKEQEESSDSEMSSDEGDEGGGVIDLTIRYLYRQEFISMKVSLERINRFESLMKLRKCLHLMFVAGKPVLTLYLSEVVRQELQEIIPGCVLKQFFPYDPGQVLLRYKGTASHFDTVTDTFSGRLLYKHKNEIHKKCPNRQDCVVDGGALTLYGKLTFKGAESGKLSDR